MHTSYLHLTTSISYSYLSCIHAYSRLLSAEYFSSFSYLDKEIDEINTTFRSMLLHLPDLLNDCSENKSKHLHSLDCLKEKLEQKYRTLMSYKREWEHIFTHYTQTHTKEILQELEVSSSEWTTFDFESFFKDCQSFVFNTTSLKEKQNKSSLLLRYLPIPLTQKAFLDYVAKSIKHISITDNMDNQILSSILHQLLDGHLCSSYGKHFSDIEDVLASLANTTEYATFYEESDLLNELLEQSIEGVELLYTAIASFSNLFIIESLSFDLLTESHISISDVYYMMKAILLETEDKILFLETLPERTEQLLESIWPSYQELLKKHPEDTLLQLMHQAITIKLSSIYTFDIVTNEDMHRYKDIDKFLASLTNYLELANPADRKLRMQYFISVIPFCMSKENFLKYLQASFKPTSCNDYKLLQLLYTVNCLSANLEDEHV